MEIPGCAPAPSIKPKIELDPCEEEEEPPLPPTSPIGASDDWEVTPLSGDNPFFTSVVCKSQVQNPFQLAIPVRFHRHLPPPQGRLRAPVVLLCRGRSWTVNYSGDRRRKILDGAAWRDFARENGLRVGDALVFELVVPAAGAGTAEAAPAPATEGKEKENDDNSSSATGKEEVVFRVQVLRGGLPEEITSRGATSDDPLVILD